MATEPDHGTVYVTTARGDLRLTETLAPDAAGPPLHLHLQTEERFTVLSGALDLTVDGKTVRLTTGQSALVPAGVAHRFSTRGLDAPRVQIDLIPSGQMEMFFKGLAEAQRQGKSALLQIAVLNRAGCDFYFAGPPTGVQRAVFAGLAWVARRMGYRTRYAEAV